LALAVVPAVAVALAFRLPHGRPSPACFALRRRMATRGSAGDVSAERRTHNCEAMYLCALRVLLAASLSLNRCVFRYRFLQPDLINVRDVIFRFRWIGRGRAVISGEEVTTGEHRTSENFFGFRFIVPRSWSVYPVRSTAGGTNNPEEAAL
jgi:hypothetical protein